MDPLALQMVGGSYLNITNGAVPRMFKEALAATVRCCLTPKRTRALAPALASTLDDQLAGHPRHPLSVPFSPTFASYMCGLTPFSSAVRFSCRHCCCCDETDEGDSCLMRRM